MVRPERQSRLRGWRSVVLAVTVALIVWGVIRALVLDVFYIPSGSMEPLLAPGDRIAVVRTSSDSEPIRRGDVVVFDGRGSFAPLSSGRGWGADLVQSAAEWFGLVPNETVYVKRVIGVGGDHVRCCTAGGKIEVNGEPVDEPYVYAGDAPSTQAFDVVVPSGRLWLLGDHRSVSSDSRALLGAPGGGLVRTDKVIGRPTAILWPLDRLGGLTTHATPKDTH
ncbi:signal peptidase I [Sinomonas sp. ASV486]|uniref:signal peptidase I n=1 Tax=Sinomonas sp. ASV486 TaxID=3051170 RepID=UPI0027DBF1D7|nr:signal peptidase I [Sinomonas sp. ASV486]MDQ4490696.1 signal peptidase I [Sinomonas sp. ASV486]